MARSARSWLGFAALVLAGCAAAPAPAVAQPQVASVQDVGAPPPGKLFSAAELDELVARIALYPDPLLALVLPASTNAIQVVQAQRFLDQNTGGEPPEDWDPAIISLCNYPEVVQMMSDDLDWTQALGDAVAAQQADVMDAVQQGRAQAQAAGNLETTQQQKVIVEREVVKIVPADPEVIYVPQYDPQVIYAPSPAPVVSYYPPRPCYWCSAAAFGTGMFIGATTAVVGAAITAPFWAFDWHHHDIGWGYHGRGDVDFDIDRDININNNISNINKNVVNKGNGNQWKPDKNRPGNRPGAGNKPNRPNRPEGGWNNPSRPGAKPGGRPGDGRPSTKPARPGDRPGGGGPGGGRPGQGVDRPGKDRPGGVAGRPTTRPAERPGGGGGRPGAERPGGGQQKPSTRPATRPGSQPTREAKGMGGYGRGQDAVKQSNRGSASRGKSSAGSSRQRSSATRGSGGSGSKSMSGYKGGGKSSAHSSRGSKSRSGGGGGGHRGGGGGGGGRGGGRR